MKNKVLIGVVGLLVVSLLLGGCVGVSQGEYDAVVAERDAVIAERDTALAQVTSLQTDLSEAQTQVASLQEDYRAVLAERDAAEANVQAIRDVSSTVQLAGTMSFLEELNFVLTTDWPDQESQLAAWQGVRFQAQELEPALVPHIDNIITYSESLWELLAAAPPETASWEELAMWEADAIELLGFYTETYRNFEVALHSAIRGHLESLDKAIAGE